MIQKGEDGELRRVEGEVRRVEGEVRRVEGEVRRVEDEVRRVEGEVTKVKSEKEKPSTKVQPRNVPLEFDSSTPKSSTILVAPEVHRSAGSGGDVPKVCHGQGLHHELPQENDFGNQESEVLGSGFGGPPRLSIVEEWDEIMKEEELIRREVAAGLPHTRGTFDDDASPVVQLHDVSSSTFTMDRPLPTPQRFVAPPEVWITEYGRVHHWT